MRQSTQKARAKEKPSIAPAVMRTLTAVTSPVPNLRVRKSDARLETMVPAEMIIVTSPIAETGAPSSTRMTGHAEPRRESGSPRLTKAK